MLLPLAIVLLVAGTALGAISFAVFDTVYIDLAGDPSGTVPDEDDRGTQKPGYAAVIAVVAGVAALCGLLHARIFPPKTQYDLDDGIHVGYVYLVCATVGSVVALLLIDPRDALSTAQQTTFYEYGFPSAFAALGLVTAGCVGATLSLRTLLRARIPGRALLGGTALGVVVAVAVAGSVVWAADDTRNVVHTTAESITAPAVPDRFGNEAYRLSVDLATSRRAEYLGTSRAVVPAGPGFVTVEPYAVVGRDGRTGEERWRYGRRSPEDGGPDTRTSATSVYSYDGGSVVVASFRNEQESAVAVGLDATTGEVLWTDDDPWFSPAVVVPGSDASGSVVHPFTWSENTLTRYDARSGQPLWTTSPTACDPGYEEGEYRWLPFATTEAVYVLDECRPADSAGAIIALDPESGDVLGTRELLIPSDLDSDVVTELSERRRPARISTRERDGDIVKITIDRGSGNPDLVVEFASVDELLTAPIRRRSGHLPLEHGPLTIGDVGISSTLVVEDSYDTGTLLQVGRQLVGTSWSEDRRRVLGVWDSDGTQLPERPFPCEMSSMHAVPGAVLVVCFRQDGTNQIIGYTP